jgi:plastocyanin
MKGIIAIIIIIIIFAVGFLILRDDTRTDSLSETNQAQITKDPISSSDVIVVPDNAVDTTPEVIVVKYSNDGFSPKEISVSIGQTVRFVNESSGNMWVGSAQHPTHIVYSGTSLKEHCPDINGDSFDQCESGSEYSFTFIKTGEWGYHNHVKPNDFGKVIVQ